MLPIPQPTPGVGVDCQQLFILLSGKSITKHYDFSFVLFCKPISVLPPHFPGSDDLSAGGSDAVISVISGNTGGFLLLGIS